MGPSHRVGVTYFFRLQRTAVMVGKHCEPKQCASNESTGTDENEEGAAAFRDTRQMFYNVENKCSVFIWPEKQTVHLV